MSHDFVLLCPSVRQSICQSVSPSVCQCQSVSLSVRQSVSPSVRQCVSVSLSVCQSVSVPVCQSASLPVCQFVSLPGCWLVSLSLCSSWVANPLRCVITVVFFLLTSLPTADGSSDLLILQSSTGVLGSSDWAMLSSLLNISDSLIYMKQITRF